MIDSPVMVKHKRLEVEDRATPERTTKVDMYCTVASVSNFLPRMSSGVSASNIVYAARMKTGIVQVVPVWTALQLEIRRTSRISIFPKGSARGHIGRLDKKATEI
jgi:hypothetical protein